MQKEMLSKEIINEKRWKNVKDYSFKNRSLNLLYIGNDEEVLECLADKYKFVFQADDFIQANFIKNNKNCNTDKPDVLFIDIPLLKNELIEFLNNVEYMSEAVIIYNNKYFESHPVNEKKKHLIDSVIDFDSRSIDTDTIFFLKNVKIEKNKCDKKNLNANKSKEQRKGIMLKRLFDLSLSFLLILIFSPLYLLIAIVIKLGSKGDVLYKSKRAGQGFKIFTFYKFRTMISNADKNVESLSHLNQYGVNEKGFVFFKISNDPRVTRIGKFLRNTSLDELPQLFNVLKGDMSFVGNRPLPLYEANNLTTNEFVDRFSAPAGITGHWQLEKRGKPEMSTKERIDFDNDYSKKYFLIKYKNNDSKSNSKTEYKNDDSKSNSGTTYKMTYKKGDNLMGDLKIMAKTPLALLQKSNV